MHIHMSRIPLHPVGKTQQWLLTTETLLQTLSLIPLLSVGKKHSSGYSQHRNCPDPFTVSGENTAMVTHNIELIAYIVPDPLTVSGENTAMVTHNIELVADIVPDPLNEGALLQAIANGPFQLGRGSFKLQWHRGDVGHLKNSPLL